MRQGQLRSPRGTKFSTASQRRGVEAVTLSSCEPVCHWGFGVAGLWKVASDTGTHDKIGRMGDVASKLRVANIPLPRGGAQ